MLKRMSLASLAVFAMVAGMAAQQNATIVTRSGEKISAQLIDMADAGFTVRVNNQERQIPTGDVAVIDFSGNGDVPAGDWARVSRGGHTIWLRNGETIRGQLVDIGGTDPLRISLKTSSGDRDLSSSEIGRIVLARPSTAVGTTGSTSTPSIPEGQGIAVAGNQQWTPTGLAVRAGETFSINATGEVRLSTDAADVASPTGSRAGKMAAKAPLPNVPAGALIGRIGNSAPFGIGDRATFSMPASGQLFLGINDDHLADNEGGYRVTLQRVNRSSR
jgi:hypothetical protein